MYFCGFCEMACPEEAIELTEIYDFSDYSGRAPKDRDGLLEVYELTKNQNYYSGQTKAKRPRLKYQQIINLNIICRFDPILYCCFYSCGISGIGVLNKNAVYSAIFWCFVFFPGNDLPSLGSVFSCCS
ncbi:MAG: hypothetical protein Ct9H300mP29_7370 [Candidatus Neomarinimicrobiota bacterium]|nr:MAG: hypothetical protein Ct9H300mP29_7370 [Candidatus Neomarinimicrobiota bacterium]